VATVGAEDLGFVETAALSPNGRLAAIAGPEVARVYAIPGGRTVATIGGQPLTALTFSPDNSRVVTGDKDGRVVIRGLTGRRDRIPLAGHTQAVSDLEVSADGTLLVSAGTDRVARVWDAVTGDEIAVLRGHTRPLRAAAFGPGKTIVTVSDDGTLRFWEAPVTAVLVGHTDRIVGLSVTPNGARVATAADDDTVRVWDARSGRQLARLDVPGVSFVAISPNGRRLVTLQTVTGRARLWDVARPRRSILIPVAGPASVAFTPDGRLVATAGPGRSIRFFGLVGQPVRSFGAPSRLDEAGRLAFSPTGDRLAVAEVGEGEAVILDAETGSEVGALPEEALRALSLTFGPDGESLGTAESEGVARFWDAHDGSADPPALAGHEGAVLSVSYAPDSGLVATAGNDGTVRIWHVETGDELLRLSGTRAAFASNADVLVTGGPGTTAHVLPCGACGSISELRARASEVEPAPGG
jgi:WD40 repeat protein